jgi:hypothetical protein
MTDACHCNGMLIVHSLDGTPSCSWIASCFVFYCWGDSHTIMVVGRVLVVSHVAMLISKEILGQWEHFSIQILTIVSAMSGRMDNMTKN